MICPFCNEKCFNNRCDKSLAFREEDRHFFYKDFNHFALSIYRENFSFNIYTNNIHNEFYIINFDGFKSHKLLQIYLDNITIDNIVDKLFSLYYKFNDLKAFL